MTGFPVLHLKLMSIELVMPSNHLIVCYPLLFLPSIFPSIRIFSNESVLCIRWPKYGRFSIQGTLKSLLQHHSSKASILRRSVFFIVQLSHPYMTIGKTIASTRWTFVGKVMSLLLNMLSRLVIAFLSRSKHLLILWLQSPSAVLLEPPKIKSLTISIVLHLFVMKWWDWMPRSLFFECWVLSHLFPLSSSTSRGFVVPFCFLPQRWCHLPIRGYWYFSWQAWFQLVLHPVWNFTRCTLQIS